MKNQLYILILIITLAACKNTVPKQNSNNLSKPQIASPGKTGDPIKTFAPLINGAWVEQSYIIELKKTQSPRLAMDSCKEITTLIINTAAVKGDSLVTMAGSLHEGIPYTIKFKNGTRPSTILFGNKDLGYEINNKDTVLVIYGNKQSNSPTMKFSRELNKYSPNLAAGLKIAMNKALMAGTYTTMDNVAKTNVLLTANGQVTGLPGVHTYMINYDFGGEPMQNLDQIFFDPDTDHQSDYVFKINKDTLSIFETTSDDADVLKIKRLKYKLVRKR